MTNLSFTSLFLVSYSTFPYSGFVTQTGHHQRFSPNLALSSQHQDDAKQSLQDTTALGNLNVPTLGIGTIAWSNGNNRENMELQALMNTACDSNAAFFDTAERYGSNFKTALGLGWGETEKLINQLLQESSNNANNGMIKNTAIIATKFTPTPWRTTVESVVEACEQSRQRLNVDQIDLYQLHMPDIVQPFRMIGLPDKPKDEIYWDGLAECYRRGLVKNVGVCNYGPTLVTKCQEALAKRGVPLASNQIGYSLIGRHNGAQNTVDKCNELGVKTLAFFPFAMGLLTGKYRPDASAPSSMSKKDQDAVMLKSLVSSKKTKLELRDLQKYVRGDGRSVPHGGIGPLLNVMETIANSRRKTIAQVALNYIICKGAIPIPGARTEAQLRDNLGAMGWRLTDLEVEMLETEADKLGFGFEGAGFKRTSEKFVGYGVERWVLD